MRRNSTAAIALPAGDVTGMRSAEFPGNEEDFQRNSVDLEGIEKLTLTSVGIDIGSSTSHLLFSRLTLRRKGAGYSAKFKVAARQVLWSSPILLDSVSVANPYRLRPYPAIHPQMLSRCQAQP